MAETRYEQENREEGIKVRGDESDTRIPATGIKTDEQGKTSSEPAKKANTKDLNPSK